MHNGETPVTGKLNAAWSVIIDWYRTIIQSLRPALFDSVAFFRQHHRFSDSGRVASAAFGRGNLRDVRTPDDS